METNQVSEMLSLFEMIKYERLMAAIVGIIIIALLVRVLVRASNKLTAFWPAKRVLFLQVTTVLSFILYIGGGGFLIYTVLKPPKEVLLALGGSAAVAIGFSLKDLVSSVVAGVILLFDRPFKVGDRVNFEKTYGEITGIGLRTTKITTLEDNMVTIPNSRFLTDVVSSSNDGSLEMMVAIKFHLSIDANLERAREIVHGIVVTSRYAHLKKSVIISVEEMFINEILALRLTVKSYVIDCRFEKEFETDVTVKVTEIFQKEKILRPVANVNQLSTRIIS
jgi:small-conductance mechanosensitive channel